MGFKFKVITPYGVAYDGKADKVMVKTAQGYIGVLERHIPLVAPVEISALFIHVGSDVKEYALSGGVLYVDVAETRIVANSCESKEVIDVKRAQAAKERAEQRLGTSGENIDVRRAELSLQRAINRIRVHEDQR